MRGREEEVGLFRLSHQRHLMKLILFLHRVSREKLIFATQTIFILYTSAYVRIGKKCNK